MQRLVLASLIAYWAGEFANSFVLAKMKPVTKGRHLWTRTIGSTVVGQAVDTATVMILVFGGTLPVLDRQPDRLRVLAKVLYEAAATPLTYTVVNYLNRKERVDVFDYNTNFNPFVG